MRHFPALQCLLPKVNIQISMTSKTRDPDYSAEMRSNNSYIFKRIFCFVYGTVFLMTIDFKIYLHDRANLFGIIVHRSFKIP